MSTTTSREACSVLLAGMERPRAESLAGILCDAGYEVVIGHGVSHDALDAGRFAAIVCDWGPRARNLLASVRGDARAGYTYVISTGSDADDATAAIDAGADDFLVEPVDPSCLLARMRVARRIGVMREAIARNHDDLSAANRELERINERMSRELRAAASVQQSLLPSPGFRAAGVRMAWRLRPCHELAGDILNCLRVDEHHLAFYVLDVSGHGVSSALLSVQVARLMSPMMTESELLKQRLEQPPWYRIVEPRAVVARLNELFQTGGGITQYFTIVYGLLHLESGRLRLAAGGHPGPIVVRASGEAAPLSFRSRPVGLFEEPDVAVHETVLAPGDRIWLYSDGVTEANDAAERELGPERLRDLVAACRADPLDRAVGGVMGAVEAWCEPAEPGDDCSLLAVERCEPPQET